MEAQGIGFMLIGGQAVLLHGIPRLTEDIDVTLAAGPESLPRVLAVCDRLGLEPLPADVEAFVQDTFVLPVADPRTLIRIDIIFSTTPYEGQAVERAVRVAMESVEVPFATAEDLILHKLFAGRPRDMEDVEGVVRRQAAGLDWAYLKSWATRFGEVPGREGMLGLVEALEETSDRERAEP